MQFYIAGLIKEQIEDLNAAMDKAGKMNNAFSKLFPTPNRPHYEWIEDILISYVKRINSPYGSIDEDDIRSIAKEVAEQFENCHKDEMCSGKCVIKEGRQHVR